MMGKNGVWGCYSISCDQSPLRGLSSALIHLLASTSCNESSSRAAARPTPERILIRPSSVSSSSSSATIKVGACEGDDAPRGEVGGCNCTVALGSVGVEPGVLRATVGEPVLNGAVEVASLIVGAGATLGAPAGRGGIAVEGVGGRGGPPGTGGRTGGASGTVDEGTAGASAALRVTRTVSFFRGTLDVCLEGVGGWFSFSLMRARVLVVNEASKTSGPRPVKPPTWEFSAFFDALFSGP